MTRKARAHECAYASSTRTRASTLKSRCRSHSTARRIWPTRAIRWLRRCWRTARACSARSFKYGRPRGIVGAGPEEPNALVQVESGALTIPNLKATQVELYDGLSARRTTGWPSLNFDMKSIGGRFARFMPAGFYYKTFQSRTLWPSFERIIRHAAGYGSAPTEPDPEIVRPSASPCRSAGHRWRRCRAVGRVGRRTCRASACCCSMSRTSPAAGCCHRRTASLAASRPAIG